MRNKQTSIRPFGFAYQNRTCRHCQQTVKFGRIWVILPSSVFRHVVVSHCTSVVFLPKKVTSTRFLRLLHMPKSKMQHQFRLWATVFWLHLLFCIICNSGASDVTCMCWTRWLLIAGSKWNELQKSRDFNRQHRCFVLSSFAGWWSKALSTSLSGGKFCRTCIQVKSGSPVHRVPYMAWKWAAWETDLKASSEGSLLQRKWQFTVLAVGRASEKRLHFPPTSLSAHHDGKKKSFVYGLQTIVLLIHCDMAQLGAMIMPPSEICHSRFSPP